MAILEDCCITMSIIQPTLNTMGIHSTYSSVGVHTSTLRTVGIPYLCGLVILGLQNYQLWAFLSSQEANRGEPPAWYNPGLQRFQVSKLQRGTRAIHLYLLYPQMVKSVDTEPANGPLYF